MAVAGRTSLIGIQIAKKSCVARATVVLLGSLPIERFVLDCLASEFGFSFKEVEGLPDVPTPNLRADAVAVLFNASSLGLEWDEALSSILNAFPEAFPILCYGFADHIDWPRMADAGAFHSIPLPFSVAELRQSLGFVWAAQHGSKRMPLKTIAREHLPTPVIAAGSAA